MPSADARQNCDHVLTQSDLTLIRITILEKYPLQGPDEPYRAPIDRALAPYLGRTVADLPRGLTLELPPGVPPPNRYDSGPWTGFGEELFRVTGELVPAFLGGLGGVLVAGIFLVAILALVYLGIKRVIT